MMRRDNMYDELKRAMIKLMVVIVDREQLKKLEDIYCKERVRFHFVCMAEGTAGSEVLDVLGLDSSDKAVVISLEPDIKITHLLEKISEKLQLHKPGKGIAFTMPLSGINNPVSKLLNQDVQELIKDKFEKEAREMRNNAKNDLIVSVVNEGYSEDLMVAAKAAGAAGGTILHGQRIGHEEAVKFLGISISSEKEIVTILAPIEKSHDIMKAISQKVGMATEAHGIVFSLPVDHIEGIKM